MLEAAEAWGRPPWEIYGGAPVLWFERWRFRRRTLIQQAQERRAEWQTKSK